MKPQQIHRVYGQVLNTMVCVDVVTDVKLPVQEVVVAADVLRQSEEPVARSSEELLAGPLAPPADRQPNISHQQQEASTSQLAAAFPAPTLPIFCSSICSKSHPTPPTHSCNHSVIRSPTHPFIHSFTHSVTDSLALSCIHSFVHSFICLLIHSVTHSFVCSFVHSFIRSFVRSFIHSFIYSFSKATAGSDLCRWPPPNLSPNKPLQIPVY